MYRYKTLKNFYKMRWTLARGLLRGNLVSQKEQVAAISTTAISEQAHQTPTRPLSSAPLPQKTTDVTDNRINVKTPVPGTLYILYFLGQTQKIHHKGFS